MTTQLICIFVFAYAKSRFSHDAAHLVFAKGKYLLVGNDSKVQNQMKKTGFIVHGYFSPIIKSIWICLCYEFYWKSKQKAPPPPHPHPPKKILISEGRQLQLHKTAFWFVSTKFISFSGYIIFNNMRCFIYSNNYWFHRRERKKDRDLYIERDLHTQIYLKQVLVYHCQSVKMGFKFKYAYFST